ncbi:type 1 glutamine amidotransferase [uncultured Cellulomonas sp.]|uniref:type 1 glutamine amidotransferase n=1 Tax=uncultured Cellulomonas sp. TaxID=189682 RepID=UPI0028EC0A30|nr:type 1 glutamine amidotransferase [uncultured Cellulomonas sp.]
MTSPLHGDPRPVVTVIQSSPDVPIDRFGEWLGDVELRLVAAFAGESVPIADEVGDGLVVLGGHMSAHDDATAPWLPELRALLADASVQGVPTLGICLGAQLLAAARGGRVQVAAPPGRESGVIDVRWRPEAIGDAVVGALVDLADERRATPQPSMHADAIVDLPRGAVWLASSAMYPYQAFRIGSAWGVQFHPEAGAETLRGWADGHEEVDTDAVLAAFAAREAEVTAVGRALAQSFAAHVRATAQEPVSA